MAAQAKCRCGIENRGNIDYLKKQAWIRTRPTNSLKKYAFGFYRGRAGEEPPVPFILGKLFVCCLFFGLIFYNGWHKQWIVAATILGILPRVG